MYAICGLFRTAKSIALSPVTYRLNVHSPANVVKYPTIIYRYRQYITMWNSKRQERHYFPGE